MSDAQVIALPEAIGSSEDLPSPPGVVVEILRLSKDEDAGIDSFAEVISGDPALAAKLIKLSNSSVFASHSEVKSLERACMLLGLKTIQLMALSFSLIDDDAMDGPEIGFSLKEYWARSLVAAVAGRSFSNRLGRRLDDELFLCGLLSQIGVLAMLKSVPNRYREVMERSGYEWPTRERESEVLGFDRSTVGAALLQRWGLPAPIYLAVRYAGCPESLPEDANDELRSLVELLHASELTTTVLRGKTKGEALRALRAFAGELGLTESALDELLTGLEEGIRETADMLDVELGSGATHAEILDEARQQVMRISLGTAAELQQAERRASHLEIENRELAQKVAKDELTGIPNRAGFDEVLAAALSDRISEESSCPLGLLMLDADHFKKFNDIHGHRAGDAVLRAIGRILAEATRDSDVAARYGGEEFAVIAPGSSPSGLKILAERLRERIEAETIVHDDVSLQVTVSIGGACLVEPESVEDAAVLIEAADERLYDAKHAGRNRCVIAEELVRIR